jgi:hypothetical protein
MDYLVAGSTYPYPVTPGRRYAVSMDAMASSATVSVFWNDTATGAIGAFVYDGSTELLGAGEGRGFEFVAPTSKITVQVTSNDIAFGLVQLPA